MPVTKLNPKQCYMLQFCLLLQITVQVTKTASVGEVIKRTLYKQEPHTEIPRILSENGRSLPRKIHGNNSDWLLHYKSLLEQWSQDRNNKVVGNYDHSGPFLEPPSPTVVNKFVSPDSKTVSYLISKAAAADPPSTTVSKKTIRPRTTIQTTSETTPTQQFYDPTTQKTTQTQETSSSTNLLFTTVKNAITSNIKVTSTSTEATTALPTNDKAASKIENDNPVSGLISSDLAAKGAAIFLTSLLGTFLPPVFEGSNNEKDDQPRAALPAAEALIGGRRQPHLPRLPPKVKTGYAQVARYQGPPRQRRREPPTRESFTVSPLDLNESGDSDELLTNFEILGGKNEASIDNAMGQVTNFCSEAIEVIGESLNYDDGLISDEQLHSLFWQIVAKHGIPLSDELKDSVEEENGGYAQQVATILDALCRDQFPQVSLLYR